MKEKSISWYLVHDVHSTSCGKNEYNGKASFYLSEDLLSSKIVFAHVLSMWASKLHKFGLQG